MDYVALFVLNDLELQKQAFAVAWRLLSPQAPYSSEHAAQARL